VQTPEDVRNLRPPDPERDGLMPTVLRYLRYMREHSVVPVGITDFQGPLTTANQLMGYDKLIYLMYDEPAAAHALMDTITTGLIDWVRAQKAVIGEPNGYCISDQQVYTGPHAGVWMSDDDAVLVSTDLYREFVVPYNSRILTAFGGGFVHYCGNATHHADNFLATEGLLGLNVFALHNLESLARLQRRVMDKLVLFVADFTPDDFGAYADDLVATLDPRGISILSEYSPIVGLLGNGKYASVTRPTDGARAVHERFVAAFERAGSSRSSEAK
jgi:uroporphyrinogen-III decarboxylase